MLFAHKVFHFNVYFLLTPFATRGYYYFESNLKLALLIKVFLRKQHVMLFYSILNMKRHFSSWVYVSVYPFFHWAHIYQKNIFKSWRFRKKIKKEFGCRLPVEDRFKPIFKQTIFWCLMRKWEDRSILENFILGFW